MKTTSLPKAIVMELQESAVITTYSGRHIDLLRPDPAVILIDDIAASLARQNRFVGHTSRDYKVAEHCLLGIEFCVPAARLEFLMHDATEGLLGDCSGPLKALAGMKFYRDLEAAWDDAIRQRFGIGRRFAKDVHVVDQRMLITEQRDLKGRMPVSTDKYKPFPWVLPARSLSSEQLKVQFLEEFYALVARTEGAMR